MGIRDRPERSPNNPARAVNPSRRGAISRSCSVTVPAPQSPSQHRHRHLCHSRRVALPNTGRSTNSTRRSPSDHNDPPQVPQNGLGVRRRTFTHNNPTVSSTPSTSTSPNPTIISFTRVESQSTGILQSSAAISTDSGGSLTLKRGYPPTSPRPHSRRAKAALRILGWSEGVEEIPVGFARVEECSDSVDAPMFVKW